MRRISWLYVATLSLGVAGAVSASDVAIVGLKLIVVDRTALLGRGKALFVAKDDQISKGSGTDPRHIEAVLHVAYDAVDGAFEMPHGGHWLANFPSIAKYVNFRAPDGGAVKMSVIEPGTLLKLIAKSAGDRPIDVSDDPQGPVYVTYAIVNGGEKPGCVHASHGAGSGRSAVAARISWSAKATARAIRTVPPRRPPPRRPRRRARRRRCRRVVAAMAFADRTSRCRCAPTIAASPMW